MTTDPAANGTLTLMRLRLGLDYEAKLKATATCIDAKQASYGKPEDLCYPL